MPSLSRTISVSHTYGLLSRQAVLAIPPVDPQSVQDIIVWFRVQPDSTHGASVDRLHFVVNDTDLTDSLLAYLQRLVDAEPAFAAQYCRLLTDWLLFEEAIGSAYPGDIATDREVAQTLATTTPLSKTLQNLGDHSAGWGGNLHLANFLYSYIRIEPISLKALLSQASHNTLLIQQVRTLAFDAGAGLPGERPLSPNRTRGRIDFHAEIVYQTPDFNALMLQIKAIADLLRVPDGPYVKQLNQIDADLATLASEVDGHEQMLQSIEKSLIEIKGMIH